MLIKFSKYFFALIFVLAFALCLNAQVPDASSSSPRGDDNNKLDYPKNLQETFARQRIKEEEKEFTQLLDRTEEVSKLSTELKTSFESNQKLTAEDSRKVDRIEKLVRKIRDELGSESDDNKDNDKDDDSEKISLSFRDVLNKIQENSTNLLMELKKSGRFTISVVAVKSSNTLLKLVRFVRQKEN